jgi:DNA-binding CsgD family transcriptional regulator/tetratricopeptide (TPR) repeat protein
MAGGHEFVGRAGEVTRIRDHLRAAGEGHGRSILVCGEPGVGKSRLAQVAVECARCLGFTVVWGRCLETEGAPPFWPWIQVLRALADSGVASGAASALAALTGASPDDDRFRLFDTVSQLLFDVAAMKPLLLVLDDLHRADQASLALLRFTADAADGRALACLGTYRDTEVTDEHPVASLIGDAAGEVDLIELRGLDRDETAEFVRQVADAEALHDLDLLHSRTSGNPFFLREVLSLRKGSDVVPTSIDAAIWVRVGRLPGPGREVLTQAAVLGRDVDPEVLGSVRGTSADEVAAALGRAVSSGLISGPAAQTGLYRFEHVLVQEALYQRIDAVQRLILHGRALDALEPHAGDPGYAVAIAHHARQAAHSAGTRCRARRLAERAADQAATTSADATAADWYRTALSMSDPAEPGRSGLLVKLGRAAGRAGRLEEARRSCEEAWELAARAGSIDEMGAAALAFGELVVSAGTVDAGLVRMLERTLARIPDAAPTALAVDLRARLASELYWGAGLDRSRTLARETVRDARSLVEPRCLAGALAARQFVLRGPDDLDERLALGHELLDLAQNLEDEDLELRARRVLVPDCLQNDLARADAEIDGLAVLARRSGRPLARWYLDLFRAVRATMSGRLDEALHQIDDAEVEGLRLGVQPASLYATGQRFLLLRQTGRVAEAEQSLRDQAARWPVLVTFRCHLALLLADVGRTGEALALLDDLVAQRCAAVPRDSLWTASVALLAETAARLGHPEHCATLHDVLAPHSGRIAFLGVVAWWGAVDHYLGLTAAAQGQHDRATAYFRSALGRHEAWQAIPFVTATVAATQGGTGRAPQRLTADGRATCGETSEAGLTTREAQVLELVAGGASTKEIARALGLSVHTVERHVANIYGKIGARNRADATGYALRRDTGRPVGFAPR